MWDGANSPICKYQQFPRGPARLPGPVARTPGCEKTVSCVGTSLGQVFWVRYVRTAYTRHQAPDVSKALTPDLGGAKRARLKKLLVKVW